MLTLRRHFIILSDNERIKLLTSLNLDTERTGYLSGLDKIFKGQLKIEKPWIGEVKKDKLNFCIKRAQVGLLNNQLSAIILNGDEVIDQGTRRVRIHFGLSLQILILFFIMSGFILTLTYLNARDAWDWLIGIFFWTIQPLIYLIDLNKTDDKFTEYVSSVLK